MVIAVVLYVVKIVLRDRKRFENAYTCETLCLQMVKRLEDAMAGQRLAQTSQKVVIKMAHRTCLTHVFIQMVQSRTDSETGCVAQVGVLE